MRDWLWQVAAKTVTLCSRKPLKGVFSFRFRWIFGRCPEKKMTHDQRVGQCHVIANTESTPPCVAAWQDPRLGDARTMSTADGAPCMRAIATSRSLVANDVRGPTPDIDYGDEEEFNIALTTHYVHGQKADGKLHGGGSTIWPGFQSRYNFNAKCEEPCMVLCPSLIAFLSFDTINLRSIKERVYLPSWSATLPYFSIALHRLSINAIEAWRQIHNPPPYPIQLVQNSMVQRLRPFSCRTPLVANPDDRFLRWRGSRCNLTWCWAGW